MARMPGAEWVGPHHSNGTMSRYDVVCLHTIVGNPPAHAAHFSTRADGHIYQSRDTAYRSAANYNGNHRVIAIENDDHGPEFGSWNVNDGHAVPAFTPDQIEANARICAWAYHVHGIPLVACPDSRPGSRGIAFHRQGINGNWAGYAYGGRASGGEVWTKAAGKVCPGDRRIAQIPQIIARARQLAGLDNPPAGPAQEDIMVRLMRGDSTAKDPNGTPYGSYTYLVRFDPELPGGAVRRYMQDGPVFRAALAAQGSVDVVPQSVLDGIPTVAS